MPAFKLTETIHYKPDYLTMWNTFHDMKVLADHEEEYGYQYIAKIIRQIIKWERRPQFDVIPYSLSSQEIIPIFLWRHEPHMGWFFPYYLPKKLFDDLDSTSIISVVVPHLDKAYRAYLSLNGAYSALIESVMMNFKIEELS